MNTGLKVLILEKTNKLLSKVRVSGGGRCNVTHNCFDAIKLSKHYPRGERSLRKVFKEYGPTETIGWFASKGVQIKTEADGRMFPVTDDASNDRKSVVRGQSVAVRGNLGGRRILKKKRNIND